MRLNKDTQSLDPHWGHQGHQVIPVHVLRTLDFELTVDHTLRLVKRFITTKMLGVPCLHASIQSSSSLNNIHWDLMRFINKPTMPPSCPDPTMSLAAAGMLLLLFNIIKANTLTLILTQGGFDR